MTASRADLMPIVRLAPAKLNLTLAIVGRRPDGYHALHSVMVPLELADRLSFAPAPSAPDSLHVEGQSPGPVEDNLILRAIALAREEVRPRAFGGAAPAPLAVRLDKRIPVAAGLGGGSSDAAAALDGALEAWGAELEPEARVRLAARLGSDVPFFLAGAAASVEGRGETVGALPPLRGESRPAVLLVTLAIAVSTADAFALFAAGVRPGEIGSAAATSRHLVAEAMAGMSGEGLVSRAAVLASANDLAPATAQLVPDLVSFRRGLMRRLGRPVGQSGSGPTMLVLYPSLDEATEAATDVREGLRARELISPGSGEPFVHATRLLWSTTTTSSPDATTAPVRDATPVESP